LGEFDKDAGVNVSLSQPAKVCRPLKRAFTLLGGFYPGLRPSGLTLGYYLASSSRTFWKWRSPQRGS